MQRFDSPLNQLLRVKRQVERLAEMEQAQAARAVARARERLKALQQQLARIAESVFGQVGGAVDPARWAAAYEHSEQLGKAITQAELDLELAENALAVAVRERMTAATESEAIATLRQEQWDKWKAEYERVGQEQLQEFVLRQWTSDRDGMNRTRVA